MHLLTRCIIVATISSLITRESRSSRAEETITRLCPTACSCLYFRSRVDWLQVICPNRGDDPALVQTLPQEIDNLLRATSGQFTTLSIKNTSLTRVPGEVCNQSTLLELTLDYNRLDALPDNCFTQLHALAAMKIRYNRITRLQAGLFDGLVNLQYLVLDHNEIETIDLRVFSTQIGFLGLKVLDLSYNRLTSLEPSLPTKASSGEAVLVGLQKVDRIYLHDNLLRTLPRSVEAINFSFTSLTLYNNPFDCSCDQRWLKAWLSSIYDRLDQRDKIHCDTPAKLHGRIIWSVNETDFCYEPSSDPLDSMILETAVILPAILVLCAVFFLIQFRYRIQWYKKFKYHPFDREECIGEGMMYDVFLSFAHEDQVFARELLAFLENNSCRVYFHERDICPGQLIMESIVDAVHTSKRVLCVVTPHFLESFYCQFEFEIAFHRDVTTNQRRLIVLKHEELDIEEDTSEDDQMPLIDAEVPETSMETDRNWRSISVLRDFVRRRGYINLSPETWRDQLLYAMPIKRLGTMSTSDADTNGGDAPP